MILVRRAKLGWRCIDDEHVNVLNRSIDLHEIGHDRVVTLELDPRNMDFLKEACGLDAMSRVW